MCVYIYISHHMLRFLRIILSLLHGGGHLVHGGYNGAAWLAQALTWVLTVRTVNLCTHTEPHTLLLEYAHLCLFFHRSSVSRKRKCAVTCSTALKMLSSSVCARNPSCSGRVEMSWAPAAAVSWRTATTQLSCFLLSARASPTYIHAQAQI